jgi:hypothetical protein
MAPRGESSMGRALWKFSRTFLVIGMLSMLASVLYAICYSNVTVYYSDGSTQSCGTFCVFEGGWLCR